jgi:hypothetical protein
MTIPTVRGIALAALMAALVPMASGCYADAEEEPAYAEGYQPQFYDGYVVYFDEGGRPYYYANGATFFVPQTSPVYLGLVNHWHVYGRAYHGWYAHRGYRYRGYRARGRR